MVLLDVMVGSNIYMLQSCAFMLGAGLATLFCIINHKELFTCWVSLWGELMFCYGLYGSVDDLLLGLANFTVIISNGCHRHVIGLR